MSARVSTCPNCGAELEFGSVASIFVVCPYCRCSSWRTDVELEQVGVLSEPHPLSSTFQLGTEGRWDGQGFTVRGQLQVERDGALWNEWVAERDDGAWLWIAETQGELWVLAEVEDLELPPKLAEGALALGSHLLLSGAGSWMIAERGQAVVRTVAGELPLRIEVGATTRYLDLVRGESAVGTLDLTRDPPELFVGRRVLLEALELDPTTCPASAGRRVKAQRVDCQGCRAPITLLDPEHTRRIACEHCGHVHDHSFRGTKALEAQKKRHGNTRLPLGAEGTLLGEKLQVLGALGRYVTVEGRRYRWTEHVLRTDAGALRFLLENNGHWTLFRPISPDALGQGHGKRAFRGRTFKHFTAGQPRVEWVVGEFPWTVRVGDETRANDWVAPPEMLSVERSADEITASHGTHVAREAVAAAFGPKRLPAPKGVGPDQPNPFLRRQVAVLAGVTLALLVILRFVVGAHHENRVVFDATFGPVPASGAPEVVFSEPFELTADGANLEILLEPRHLNQGWVGLGGGLVQQDTGAVTTFGLSAQYYHGGSGEDAWKEGSGEGSTFVGPLAAGPYRLRLDASGEGTGVGTSYRLRLRSQVPRTLYFVLAFLAVLVVPLFVFVAHAIFEVKRWEDSDHPLVETE